MGRTAIVTGGMRKDVSAMGTLAINIKDVMPDIADELIIFHDGINKSNQRLIQNIFPTKFIKFSFPLSFKDRRTNSSLRYFSSMVFCKYECLKLLSEYDKVMWTDYDVVFLKDISELWNDKEGLTIVEDSNPLRGMFLDRVKNYKLDNFDLNQKGVCTPLFVVSRNIGNYMEYYEWCVEATRNYAGCIYLPEQCIWSLAIQKFGIKYSTIDPKKYVCSVREQYNECDDISIIHCVGRPKFWEGRENAYWQRYYDEWIAMGGNKYRKPLKEKLIELKNYGKGKDDKR